MTGKNKIAYLAPEIPALSATFVYNEILELERRGFAIVPLSVHVPDAIAKENKVQDLAQRTHYIYRESFFTILWANIYSLIRNPHRYIRALFAAIKDSLHTGIFSHIGRGLIYRFLFSARVANILIKERCAHLHVHFAHVPTDMAMYASMMSGTPFSFTSHANDLFERGWLLKEKVERSYFAATISEYNRRFLINKGAPKDKIKIVRCGVDTDTFKTMSPGSSYETPRIGTLGRMVEKKGFDVLIKACGKLKKDGFKFNLEIAGDGPLRDELEELVKSLDLLEDVSFIGPLSHDNVPLWLRKLDLFILPCRKDHNGDMDGIPVVLMEAMLSGVMVISTLLSGIPELIEDNKTGRLVNPDDPETLALSIRQTLSDYEFNNELRKNAVNKVQSEFDLKANVEKLSDLFNGATS